MPPLLREREPPLFEREPVPFERALDFDDDDLPLLPELDDLPVADERLAPAAEDLARLVPDFFAPPLEERDEADLAPAVERFEDVLRLLLEPEPELRPIPLEDEPELAPLDDMSALHLPDMTRCAASATASAISEPNLVALAMTLLAARSAVSAASSPASRIFLRAPGLAAIAAAAAVSPAASISLLIAALAILSTVDWLEPALDVLPLEREDEDPRDPLDLGFEELLREEVLRVDLAIFISLGRGKDTLRPFRFPNEVRTVVRRKKIRR